MLRIHVDVAQLKINKQNLKNLCSKLSVRGTALHGMQAIKIFLKKLSQTAFSFFLSPGSYYMYACTLSSPLIPYGLQSDSA